MMIRRIFFSPCPISTCFCRMGILACYLDPQDLGSYLQDAALSLALLQQLARCTSEGFISDGGRVSRTLNNPSVNEQVHPFGLLLGSLCVCLTGALLVGSDC